MIHELLRASHYGVPGTIPSGSAGTISPSLAVCAVHRPPPRPVARRRTSGIRIVLQPEICIPFRQSSFSIDPTCVHEDNMTRELASLELEMTRRYIRTSGQEEGEIPGKVSVNVKLDDALLNLFASI